MDTKGNKKYTLAQLLDDDYFILSVKHPTLESDIFWKDVIQKGYVNQQTYNLAKKFILSVQPGTLGNVQKKRMWEEIGIRNTEKQKKRSRLRILFSATAACILVLCALSVGYFFNSPVGDEYYLAIHDKPDISADHIQLILSGEKPLSIKDKNADIQYTEKGEVLVNSDLLKEEYIVTEINENKRRETYNQLIVPKGQQSSLTLSDGTRIWINAGSRVIYPPLFNNKERIIHVEGEVFLEVFHDNKRPFIVKTKEFDIRVTGTSFNVSSYEDIDSYSVVLVEGAVKVKTKNIKEEIALSPGQKLSYSDKEYDIETVNTSFYVAWKNGFYQYKAESMTDIAARLSYYYNRNIYCDETVAAITCSGKLDLKQDIEKVLETLCKGALPITFYEKNNNYYIKQAD